MSFETPGVYAPADPTCRYGVSRLQFRGPQRDLDVPFVACIGGTETFGRFVPDPFPACLEKRLKEPCVNLGCVNGGLDAVLHDPELRRLAQMAEYCVFQAPGAQNLSNRYYRVHPRRNDRFVAASKQLTQLYPDVDFTEFHFNKHMLGRLHALSPVRFDEVRQELQAAWSARMRSALVELGSHVVLVCLRYQQTAGVGAQGVLGAEPLLVTEQMIAHLREHCRAVVEIPVRTAGVSDELGDMLFGTLQQPAAEHMLGPVTHEIIADRIYRAIQDLN